MKEQSVLLIGFTEVFTSSAKRRLYQLDLKLADFGIGSIEVRPQEFVLALEGLRAAVARGKGRQVRRFGTAMESLVICAENLLLLKLHLSN